MAVRVDFKDKTGKKKNMVFQTQQMAETYAKGVMEPVFTQIDLEIKTSITKYNNCINNITEFNICKCGTSIKKPRLVCYRCGNTNAMKRFKKN